MNDDLNDSDREYIERLVDKHGLAAVLMAISTICAEKSMHVAHDWQDVPLAKRWSKLADALEANTVNAEGL